MSETVMPEAYSHLAHANDVEPSVGHRHLREHCPLHVEESHDPPFYVLSRHADVFEVSRRSDVFWNTEKSAPGPDLQYDMLQAMGIELPRTLVHIHGEALTVPRCPSVARS